MVDRVRNQMKQETKQNASLVNSLVKIDPRALKKDFLTEVNPFIVKNLNLLTFESLSMLRSNIIKSQKVGRFYQAKSSDEAGIQTLISTLEMRMIAVVNTYGRRKMSLRHLYTGKTLARKALMH